MFCLGYWVAIAKDKQRVGSQHSRPVWVERSAALVNEGSLVRFKWGSTLAGDVALVGQALVPRNSRLCCADRLRTRVWLKVVCEGN